MPASPGASRCAARALAVAAALAVAPPSSAVPAAGEFSADEIARIVSHGPWPPPPARDPSNRASGHPGAIALGQRLFSDPALSAAGSISCASCHDPGRGFTDGKARAVGLARHDRNTQGLLDAGDWRWFGWDGGADTLWAATLRPLLSPVEMGSDPARIAARLRPDASAMRVIEPLFGPQPDDESLAVAAAKSIAAWVETRRSPRTAFDAFRDAIARGDAAQAARYPAAARRGLKLFVGRGNCGTCHVGPAFSNSEFHDVGRPFVVEPGRVDPGRHAGIRRVQRDRYNLLGPFNDERGAAPGRSRAMQTRTVVLQHRNWGEWRTPTLRGLCATAPYMHDGSLATLRDVVRHYSALDLDRLHADGESLLQPLDLSPREIDDLVAFLETLSPSPCVTMTDAHEEPIR
ncbi:MAG TPA: cytochrome c peroxidase [Zeimonas sp.]|nr:cytochrome c peroxidase [Zeimonas sp.]